MATTASVGEGVWVALAAAEASPAVVSAAVSVLVCLVVGSVGVSMSVGMQWEVLLLGLLVGWLGRLGLGLTLGLC